MISITKSLGAVICTNLNEITMKDPGTKEKLDNISTKYNMLSKIRAAASRNATTEKSKIMNAIDSFGHKITADKAKALKDGTYSSNYIGSKFSRK